MTQMKVASHTTLRMATVQDAAGDVVAMVEVAAVDMAMGIMADAAAAAMPVGEPTLLERPTLPRAALICRLKATLMMTLSSYMIT